MNTGRIIRTAVIMAVCTVVGTTLAYWRPAPAPELIEYRAKVHNGDTLWGIASRIATDHEDIREVIYRMQKDNGIRNPGELQPGTELIVRVMPAKED